MQQRKELFQSVKEELEKKEMKVMQKEIEVEGVFIFSVHYKDKERMGYLSEQIVDNEKKKTRKRKPVIMMWKKNGQIDKVGFQPKELVEYLEKIV